MSKVFVRFGFKFLGIWERPNHLGCDLKAAETEVNNFPVEFISRRKRHF
jgi:hypothetical protein